MSKGFRDVAFSSHKILMYYEYTDYGEILQVHIWMSERIPLRVTRCNGLKGSVHLGVARLLMSGCLGATENT